MEAIAAQGRDRGFVTSTDLLRGLSVEDLGPEQVEAFLTDVQEYLRHEGIEVLETRREASEDEVGKPHGIRRGRDDVFANDPVRLYLNGIAKVRLLTAAQEVDLAMRMEAGGFAAQVLAAIGPSEQAVVDSGHLAKYSPPSWSVDVPGRRFGSVTSGNERRSLAAVSKNGARMVKCILSVTCAARR
jgi:hypothetical protein